MIEAALDLSNLKYKGMPVRLVIVGDEPWWSLADVCCVLELENPRKVAARLDDDEKGCCKDVTKTAVTFSYGTSIPHNATLINEAGLYSVVLRSSKAEAKAFKRWVTHEVLPQIRKTGSYGMPQMPAEINADFLQAVADHVRTMEQKLEAQQVTIDSQDQRIAELEPKATYHDRVLQAPDLVTVTVIAKDYGMSAVRFNALLHELKIQYRSGDTWVLYQEYAGLGYTRSRTCAYQHKNGTSGAKIHMYWTHAGRFWLYEMLKAAGILPLIEMDPENAAVTQAEAAQG